MKHYVYCIENTLNKKKYIGITNNPKRRKTRHFSDLRCGIHDSKKLQSSFNKHGEKKFIFDILVEKECKREDILELEKEYVEKFDTFKNGYNMNKGGLENNGFSSKFSKEDVFNILSAYEFTNSRIVHGSLQEIYKTSRTNFYRMRKGLSHLNYKEEYELMPIKDREKIYEKFYQKYNMKDRIIKFASDNKNTSLKRRLDDKSVFMILSIFQFEHKITVPNMIKISEKLNISIMPIKTIKRKGIVYLETIEKYNSLPLKEQNNLYINSKIYFNLN